MCSRVTRENAGAAIAGFGRGPRACLSQAQTSQGYQARDGAAVSGSTGRVLDPGRVRRRPVARVPGVRVSDPVTGWGACLPLQPQPLFLCGLDCRLHAGPSAALGPCPPSFELDGDAGAALSPRLGWKESWQCCGSSSGGVGLCLGRGAVLPCLVWPGVAAAPLPSDTLALGTGGREHCPGKSQNTGCRRFGDSECSGFRGDIRTGP